MDNQNVPKPGTGLVALAAEAASIEAMIMQLAEANGGEIDDALDRYLDGIKAQIAEKPDNYKYVIDRLQMGAELLAEQAQQFDRAATAMDHTAEAMKFRIKEAIELLGVKSVQGKTWKFSLRGTTKRLVVDDAQVASQIDAMQVAVGKVLEYAVTLREKTRAGNLGGAGSSLLDLGAAVDQMLALEADGFIEPKIGAKLVTAKVKAAAEGGATPFGAKLEGGWALTTGVVKAGS